MKSVPCFRLEAVGELRVASSLSVFGNFGCKSDEILPQTDRIFASKPKVRQAARRPFKASVVLFYDEVAGFAHEAVVALLEGCWRGGACGADKG